MSPQLLLPPKKPGFSSPVPRLLRAWGTGQGRPKVVSVGEETGAMAFLK